MKNYQIKFYDGKTEFVTMEAYGQVIKLSSNPNSKTFELNGNLYRFSDIRRMQEPRGTGINQIDRLLKDKTKEKQIRGLDNMMIGLKKFMCSDKYCQSDVTKKLLKAMELRHASHTK
jgi:hypothetical protein